MVGLYQVKAHPHGEILFDAVPLVTYNVIGPRGQIHMSALIKIYRVLIVVAAKPLPENRRCAVVARLVIFVKGVGYESLQKSKL